MTQPRNLGATAARIRSAPFSDEAWAALVASDESDVVETDGGEMVLSVRDGQLQLDFAFDTGQTMQVAFGPLFEALRPEIPAWGFEYLSATLVEFRSRRWITPLLDEADFIGHGEWIDMRHPAVDALEPPEIPGHLTMRRAGPDDHDAIVALEREAYDEWSDGEVAARSRLEEAAWSGVLLDGDELVAYAVNSAVDDSSGRRLGRVLSAGVAPDHRRAGLGRTILGAATYQLGSAGAAEAIVRVRPDIPGAVRTAASLGYDVGERGREYRRPTDEEQIAARRARIQHDGVKVRFGDWR